MSKLRRLVVLGAATAGPLVFALVETAGRYVP